jgi:3-phosphoshikimate 1-carboxyvinyltransferase
MILRFKDRTFEFSVDAPPSKSVFHRELIVRFLKGYEDDLEVSSEDSKDIAATKNCLRALRDGGSVLDCNESGSTLRFMIPVAAAWVKAQGVDRKITFKTAGRLYDRPLDDLENCLKDRGVSLVRDDSERTISLKGTLTEGQFVIDGSVSSQYVSGIMMALIVLPDSSIKVTGEPSSVHYIELTKSVIDKYENGKHEDFRVEGDWSGGAFLLCLKELIKGGITVGNLDDDSVQGDKAIVDFLKAVGVDELTWDCRDIPDIVPYMAMVAAFRNKVTVFNNIGRLRVKESDRVMAVRQQLAQAGIQTEETEETLTVFGNNKTFDEDMITLKSYNDHRMVMSAMLIAAALGVDLEIDSIDPVDKSFPGLKELIREEFS